ncbi:MAG: UTP--glucose-1-phosphate uridylyltransferase GalU [Leptospirales bacterium]
MSTIRTCIFPAAGYGTRFLPATKSMPKEMLPILTKPLIQYGVEEAVEAGVKNIGFITGRGKRSLEDHFDKSYELEHQIKGTDKEKSLTGIRNIIEQCTISYTRQKEMKGLGHAVLCGEHFIKTEAFSVILADDLCDNDGDGVMKQMVQMYEKYKCSIVACMEVPREDAHRYGIISGTEEEPGVIRANDLVEKPKPGTEPSNMAVIGRYILTSDIFNILRKLPPGANNEIQLTDALKEQAKNGRVIAYKFKGKRYDCGIVDGFVQATVDLYEKQKS